MRYALIDADGRVAQIENSETEPFGVAAPLFWIECGDPGVRAYSHTYADGLFVPIPPPPDADAQRQAALVAAVQAHLDATARSYGYDNIYTACTYADEPAVAQFQAEGQALRAWRSLVWLHCHAVLAAVLAELRPEPDAATLIAELPALVMPG